MPTLKNRFLLLAALPLAASLFSAGQALAAMEDSPGADPGSYLNGGVGIDGREDMRAERAHYNLRLAFAQAHSGEYLAGLTVTIAPQGKNEEAQRYEDCGPLLYVQLKPGHYHITAEYGGKKQELSTTVGAKGVDRVLYWR